MFSLHDVFLYAATLYFISLVFRIYEYLLMIDVATRSPLAFSHTHAAHIITAFRFSFSLTL